MAKCPYCKQVVTLDKTKRESEKVLCRRRWRKKCPEQSRKKSCTPARTAIACWASGFSSEEYSQGAREGRPMR